MKPRLPPLLGVRDLLRLYKVRAQKRLSQNFLLDPTIVGKFVSKATPSGCHVLEVGPGPGSITRALLQSEPKSLVVVEKDTRFLPFLHNLSDAYGNDGRMKVLNEDILDFDWSKAEFPESEAKPWEGEELPNIRLIGNLPFSIATPLLINWLSDISARRGPWSLGRVPLTLSFQQEVANRIVARDGTPDRCRLSVMCQSLCHVTYGMTINGGSFVPAPKVNAGVVVFVPRVQPLVPFEQFGFSFFERVVRDIFNRKNAPCSSGIGNLVPTGLRELVVPNMLDQAGVSDEGRLPPPTFLKTEEFGKIALALKKWHAVLPPLADYNFRSPKVSRITGEDLIEQVEGILKDMQANDLKRGNSFSVS